MAQVALLKVTYEVHEVDGGTVNPSPVRSGGRLYEVPGDDVATILERLEKAEGLNGTDLPAAPPPRVLGMRGVPPRAAGARPRG